AYWRSCRRLRGAGARNRPDDSIVGAAAAEVTVERRSDLSPARVWLASNERRRRNQDAGEAVAALSGVLVEEGVPQRLEHVAEALDGSHHSAGEARDLARARIGRLAVDQHHAGAALLGAAAETAAAQAKLVTQHREQRRRAVARDVHRLAV